VNPAGLTSRCQKLPFLGDAHVHRGVALHRPGHPLLGLPQCRLPHPIREEPAKQQRQDKDHDRPAD
jgi:hypothetical protein